MNERVKQASFLAVDILNIVLITLAAIFGVFGAFMVLHLLWAVFAVPETKGRPLEDIKL